MKISLASNNLNNAIAGITTDETLKQLIEDIVVNTIKDHKDLCDGSYKFTVAITFPNATLLLGSDYRINDSAWIWNKWYLSDVAHQGNGLHEFIKCNNKYHKDASANRAPITIYASCDLDECITISKMIDVPTQRTRLLKRMHAIKEMRVAVS